MPKERWFGFIKDYEGGTLMECRISPKVDYLRLFAILNEQQEAVQRAILRLKPPRVFPGLTCWQKDPTRVLHPSQVPGVVEYGWTPQAAADAAGEGAAAARPLHEQIVQVLDILARHHSAWPFHKPVAKDEAPDYYEIIAQPTDISTMKKKAKKLVAQRTWAVCCCNICVCVMGKNSFGLRPYKSKTPRNPQEPQHQQQHQQQQQPTPCGDTFAICSTNSSYCCTSSSTSSSSSRRLAAIRSGYAAATAATAAAAAAVAAEALRCYAREVQMQQRQLQQLLLRRWSRQWERLQKLELLD
ncbi:histone acetyltransferase GCN5, putative [Eimeria acervulina]|uniref:Histone acetyltransferase GCN5, putative n=1 Tax=Eimeria acervulina TaxID=5801 RepID=U6GSY7_EIMAC|nr:histone acetyltransferase GCN5, putative [Eimeria acervulina]CDI83371.1 histone acetyltransferase GCN5, putative [Eimeria acervulina]